MRRPLVLSVAAHAVVFLLLELSALNGWGVGRHGNGGTGGGSAVELDVVKRTPGQKAHEATQAMQRKHGPARRVATAPAPADRPLGRVLRGSPITPTPSTDGDGVAVPTGEGSGATGTRDGGLLCMRNCKPGKAVALEPTGDALPEPEPQIVSKREYGGARIVRYADGGRLFSRTSTGAGNGGSPDLGMLGLLDLADGIAGDLPGRKACNPYRQPLAGTRTLVLLVDTSQSVKGASTACAAGAALSGLEHGYEVEVVNFSSASLYLAPTRDATKIYETLSRVQGETTLLPTAKRLIDSSARPRDFVFVTDTAIHNWRVVLPSYAEALRTHPANRGVLYLIGDGTVCEDCERGDDPHSEFCTVCRKKSRIVRDAFERLGVESHPLSSALDRWMATIRSQKP
jgi:hypothetical protein